LRLIDIDLMRLHQLSVELVREGGRIGKIQKADLQRQSTRDNQFLTESGDSLLLQVAASERRLWGTLTRSRCLDGTAGVRSVSRTRRSQREREGCAETSRSPVVARKSQTDPF